ncbi:hypothetical protein JD969_19090 [Planctomycetota bacterium]|nr:hypothetical protein JD969_19090 [Planctomycetota bacterium]
MQANDDQAAHDGIVRSVSIANYQKGVGMPQNINKIPDHTSGETWDFHVRCYDPVDQVFLVHETADGVTSWIPMNSFKHGAWSIRMHLVAGWYRFKYYTATGSTYFNCGTHGLMRELISGVDNDVIIEPFAEAASA